VNEGEIQRRGKGGQRLDGWVVVWTQSTFLTCEGGGGKEGRRLGGFEGGELKETSSSGKKKSGKVRILRLAVKGELTSMSYKESLAKRVVIVERNSREVGCLPCSNGTEVQA